MTSYMNIMKEIEENEQAGKEAYSGYDMVDKPFHYNQAGICLLYTSPSPRDLSTSRMPSSA